MQKILPDKPLSKLDSYKLLKAYQKQISAVSIKEHFKKEHDRLKYTWLDWENMIVDVSKNRIDKKGFNLLIKLAKEAGLEKAIEAQFKGEKINTTENRAVLHTSLRNLDNNPIFLDDKDIIPELRAMQQKMYVFCEKIINGQWRGYTGKKITHVINIGIGGSDLGPKMVVEALSNYKNHLDIRFISNIEGDHHKEILKGINPETTLFVIVSKSFSTQETITNANSIRNWFLKKAPQSAIEKNFVAVSSNVEKTVSFGISSDNVFPMKDWVGGRFSLWSSVGLIICLAIGPNQFRELLEGAGKMDYHFRNSPFEKNIPVILGLISIWYNNFWGSESQAIIPYTEYLRNLPAYLQQAFMESNGKIVGRDGNLVNYQTGSIIWGASGTNAQHAFFQLIHQGTKLIPTDFICFRKSLNGNEDHQNKLLSNFIAQTEALMNGKNETKVLEELNRLDMDPLEQKKIAPFKIFEGNKPTNTILIDKLTPASLGSLIAMYEHKIYVQGVIWNIFSYDQWGVELGKQLANKVLDDIEGKSKNSHDPSTKKLIEIIKNRPVN